MTLSSRLFSKQLPPLLLISFPFSPLYVCVGGGWGGEDRAMRSFKQLVNYVYM